MAMRALFWGMNGVYTWTVLEELLFAGASIAAVLVDGSATNPSEQNRAYQRLTPPTAPDEPDLLPLGHAYVAQNTVNTAWRHGLPVYAIHNLAASDVTALLASFNADVACVACFPKRLPPTMLSIPRHGFLNVHPSYLPDYRGPAPLFWQLRDGVDPMGVTVHWMDAHLDSGDIAAQVPVALPDGIRGPGADRLLGGRGGQLLAGVLSAVRAGKAKRRAQGPGGSYQPIPKGGDFWLDPSWPARRAFNFMRGAAEWGRSYVLRLEENEVLLLKDALRYSPQGRLGTPYSLEGEQVLIQFAPGVLTAVLA